MKKFALLGAVAALATAGGVFAAWSFSDASSKPTIGESEIVISVDDDILSKGYGSFAKTSSKDFTIAFNGGGETDANTIDVVIDGGLTYAYTAPETDEYNTLTVSAEWADGVAKTYTYEGTDVTVTVAPIGYSETFSDTNKTLELGTDDIKVTVNDKTIDSAAELTAFNSLIDSIELSIIFTVV